jgi:hypothetical protein
MSKRQKLDIDPRLDAEDCTNQCPVWLSLSLAAVGIISITGHYFFA